jgi:hypothetical protein
MMEAILIRKYVLNFVQGSSEPFFGLFLLKKKRKKSSGRRVIDPSVR